MVYLCGECYNLGKIDTSVVVPSLFSILFLISPKIQGMSSLALHFYNICDRIWENSPLCTSFQDRVIGIQG